MTYTKAFLKWPGGKYRLLRHILPCLPPTARLVEPFFGSGVVSLNAPHSSCLLCDSNADLIDLFTGLQREGEACIDRCRRYFTPENNTEPAYYRHRDAFNAARDAALRGALFVYLNRHGYNGLVRYNAGGGFNVPFGRYKNPYFPEKEMRFFLEQQRRRRFVFKTQDFRKTFARLRSGDVVYCDPPYMPLSATSSFTTYSGNAFTLADQEELAALAVRAAARGIPVVVSNHDTPETRALYARARLTSLDVRRTISCDGRNRRMVREIVAVFA